MSDSADNMGLLLSGDFQSPHAVMASSLEKNDKIEILEGWLTDLKNISSDEANDLRGEIQELLDGLRTA